MLPPFGGHYKIPSQSMSPTLNIDDHFQVNRRPYAFNDTKIPEYGKIIVFKNSKTGGIIVSRVIGLPNDRIETVKGRLYLNEIKIERTPIGEYFLRGRNNEKTLVKLYNEKINPNTRSYHIFEESDMRPLDNSGPFLVPKGHIFVMGDNRDNSVDSRSRHLEFIPVENIIGEGKRILFSTRPCKFEVGFYCPEKNFFNKL